MNQAPIIEFDLDIAKDIADQCICHPVSRSVDDIERAGEAIKYLLWVIEKTRATAAVELDRAQRGEPVLWRYRDSEQVIRAMDGYTPVEGWTPLYTATQPAHTEAEVQALLDAGQKLATMRYDDAEFEKYVRRILGVPKP